MLNNVWSVRKDVRVNVAKTAKDTQIGSKSCYSRHGEISGIKIMYCTVRIRTKLASSKERMQDYNLNPYNIK